MAPADDALHVVHAASGGLFHVGKVELAHLGVLARHGDDWQVEAFNCVFHGLARQHPQVCKFDLAYMEAATGRRIHHMECIVRGGHVCRFKIGSEAARG